MISPAAQAVIRVPATSANLGPGFDCLGLAVNLQLTVRAELSAADRLLYRGDGSLPDTPGSLLHQGFQAAYRAAGLRPPAVTFHVENPIPLARGLGSSSAALVAGAAAADVLLGEQLGRDGIFQLCARLEGHPDNVAPAVYGGFTVSAQDAGAFVTRSLPLPDSWRYLFAVPSFELSTEQARGLLPDSYPRSAVIHTSSRTALWVLAVSQADPALLRVASQDVLHEPYREPLLPRFTKTVAAVLEQGAFAAYLSGAGPTLAVICDASSVPAVTETLREYSTPTGQVIELQAATGYAAAALEVR